MLEAWRRYLYALRARRSDGRLRIGRQLRARVPLIVRGPGRVRIGDDVTLDSLPGERRTPITIYTHSADALVVIGDRCTLCSARISCKFLVELGTDVLVEDAAITDTDFHSVTPDRGEPIGEALERCRVSIGNGVALGARSVVTKGVCIGANAVVAPGAIVTRHLAPGSLAMGNPARVITSDGAREMEQ